MIPSHFKILPSLIAAIWASQGLASELTVPTDTTVKFCNKSEQKIFTAVGYESTAGGGIESHGWWGIDAGACTDVTMRLAGDNFYLYGNSLSQILEWTGATKLCVEAQDAFDYTGASAMACDAGHQEFRMFKELSVSAITPAGQTPVYDFLPADAVKTRDLARFCNDTAGTIYLAFGQTQAAEIKVHVGGWYPIESGKCFEARREVRAQAIYYFAQGGGRKLLWSGDVPLCTDDFAGFEYADAGGLECKANNQLSQLFKRENLTADAFEHHFVAADARPARSNVKICNNRAETVEAIFAWTRPDFPSDVITNGWFSIKAGDCVRDFAVDSDRIFINVTDEDGMSIVEGNFEACINNMSAFLYSHANTMSCDGDDQEKGKFAVRNLPAGDASVDID